MIKLFCSLLLLIWGANAFAQSKTSPLKKADALSVRASLENMLVQRYTQELSSIVDKSYFNIGAKFNLSVVNTEKRPQDLEYNDLELGYLDADELFDAYSMPNMAGVSPFEKYSIRGLDVHVGLSSSVNDEIKKSVEDWIAARVKEDFGVNGRTEVKYIMNPEVQLPEPLMKRVQDMQGLVGNIILAFALLLGVILWQVMGGSKPTEAQAGANSQQSISINSKTEMAEAANKVAAGNPFDAIAKDKVEHLSDQIKDLAPKVVDQLENLVEQWVAQGQEGLYLVASFAEIAGSILGSMPIPKEERKNLGNIFAEMHDIDPTTKSEYLSKVYWDLVSALNLGAESLSRPFSFIGNSALGTVNNVLLGNDLETQTVVTLFMPEKMRKKYFESLDEDKRVELLNAAAKLSAISEESLLNIEDHIAPYFGENELEESSVPMDMTLNKLIDAMSFIDACISLPEIKGPVMDKYRLKYPHIGLLSEWDKSAIALIAKYASNEALVAYSRVVPDMKNYILEYVPPRTKQILEDDLNQEDKMSLERKEELLSALHSLILNLVENGELSLEDVVQIEDNKSDENMDVAA